MTSQQAWINWCQKQLGDLSLRLTRQGYHQARIEYLNRTVPEFRVEFEGFTAKLGHIMDDMASNPEGYRHFESFSQAKRGLLNFTSHHRESFLNMGMAESA